MILSMWHLRGLIAVCASTSRNARAPRDGEERSISSRKISTSRYSKTVSVRRPRNLKRNIVREQESRGPFLKGCERLDLESRAIFEWGRHISSTWLRRLRSILRGFQIGLPESAGKK